MKSPAVEAARAKPPLADRVVPIRGYARAMARAMTEALKIPHFGYNDEVFAFYGFYRFLKFKYTIKIEI